MLQIKVRAIVNEAVGINCFELVDPHGRELPAFEAGAHIDVMVPGNFVRQYSLCNDSRERLRYVIGVLRHDEGRGGSLAMHARVRAGDLLTISNPRNNFALDARAHRHLLIAGGIGVTPMMAMVESLESGGAEFHMHYCARSPDTMAFKDRLAALRQSGQVSYHYDDGDFAKGLNLAEVLGSYQAGTHLYYCGPAGLMRAIAKETAAWPVETVHSESFATASLSWSAPDAAVEVMAGGFDVKLARSGMVVTVPRGRSIVEVLRGAGIECTTSCEAGVCGTCRTRYLEGTPEHHDFVLSEDERKEYLMICCARATSQLLVLDR